MQESLFRAWTNAAQYREQAAIKTWLYKIATNVCLDALATSTRHARIRPVESTPAPGVVRDDLVLETRPREYWVEPIPDLAALPNESDIDPAERAVLKASIRLAFVAALQYLPPRQRAVLLVTQVLNYSAAETAEMLDMSVASVNSALQRARSTLDTRNPAVAPREHSIAITGRHHGRCS